jgi:hypothetical protein
LQSSLYDMPIGKLVLIGMLGEEDLARLIAAATALG